jgi:DNA end-binding protein Ku
MRATWSGMISFGLVNIPVKLFPAARDQDISFHQMHREDSGRVRHDKVCKVCNNVLGKDDIVKGYEFRKGQYVFVTDEELTSINLTTAKTITISNFVDAAEVDPIEFERAYYVAPDENGDRAYVLLRQALAVENKVGIGKVSMGSREKLAAIRLSGHALILETMYFADEIADTKELGIPAPDFQVSENELDLAKVLIEHMAAPFDPSAYHDDYEQALKDLINKKVAGEEVTAPTEPEPTKVIDIMAALKASLDAAEKEPVEAKRKSA